MHSDWSAKAHIRRGTIVVATCILGLGLWAGLARISGAVVAPGVVEIEARQQKVQHAEGGIVAEILARNGEALLAEAPLLRLDDTHIAAEIAIVTRAHSEVRARATRLEAELRRDATLTFAPDLLARAASNPELAHILDEERRLFAARQAVLAQTDAQWQARIAQTEASILGIDRQLAATRRLLGIAEADLATQEELFKQGLVKQTAVTRLQREQVDLAGQVGALEARIGEAKSAIAGYELERLGVGIKADEAAQSELREIGPELADLAERLRVLEVRQDRLTLRAPMAGVVHDLQVSTLGSVIPAGGTVAAIVPDASGLVLSMRLNPAEIDRVWVGQGATIRFPALNARVTPDVDGVVTEVAADIITDEVSGERYYAVRIDLAESAADAIPLDRLIPGMPAEAYLEVEARTVLSYLLKPATDHLARAMKER
ncbi:MAG: HlyD family type I secretion periplasmic adaptor subunit [Paracoccaceae bacterium]|nr:HlyD family type I secretion periplasmic adaptor subunit [Paracoccaceae bacterium]